MNHDAPLPKGIQRFLLLSIIDIVMIFKEYWETQISHSRTFADMSILRIVFSYVVSIIE